MPGRTSIDWDSWEAGKDLGVSVVFITKEFIFNYVQAVEDYDPIFLNSTDGEKAGFGGLVAPASYHAQFTYMKWATGDEGWVPQGSVHVKQKFQFRGIVREGDQLYTKVTMGDKYEKNGRKYVVYKTTVTNQHGEKICTGEMINLLPS
ncbi:MAG: MaoC family dehydratase N-terminal domain-containing protein [Deltaproteobacteria bacterium]|nr:MaoC family dehydratase N-terminal domain-containing protein [Deltaproteobacteria bacterium]